MNLDARRLAIAAALVIAAAGSWWLSQWTTVPGPVVATNLRHDPDYIVENFHSTIMTPAGLPELELRGKRLLHYRDDGSSTIELPYVIQYNPGRAATHARAKQGYMPKELDYIRLTGDVLVAQGRDPRSAGGEVHTQTLTLKLDRSQ